jgi:hypothetical protein
MKPERADAGAVLSALHQAYYALYAVLIRNGAIQRGEVSELLRLPATGDFIGQDGARWLEGIADELDVIDSGRKPSFGVVEGGKHDS